MRTGNGASGMVKEIFREAIAPKCVPELPFLLQVSVLVEEIMKEV